MLSLELSPWKGDSAWRAGNPSDAARQGRGARWVAYPSGAGEGSRPRRRDEHGDRVAGDGDDGLAVGPGHDHYRGHSAGLNADSTRSAGSPPLYPALGMARLPPSLPASNADLIMDVVSTM